MLDPREAGAIVRRHKQQVAAVLAADTARWRLAEAGVLLGMSAGLVSELRRGMVDRIAMDRLLAAAELRGFDVEITLHPRARRPYP